MEEFKDRTAVITGAASGIGYALAERCGAEGMNVVMADVEEAALETAHNKLSDLGVNAIAVKTDVSQAKQLENLTDRAYEAFGAVHILCNNAGVGGGSMRPLWEQPLNNWKWVMGVNLWGVIHGIRAFMPRMVEQATEGHVVNTASSAGLLTGSGIYGITKHAVVSLSEGLYQELAATESKIGVSVLCPGFVDTNITESERNRPEDLPGEPPPESIPEEAQQRIDYLRGMLKSGYRPAEIADAVFEGIRKSQLYVVPAQPMIKEGIRSRLDNVANEHNPAPRRLPV
ncbi:MAG: SDR family NAD(P)-dependent oxidoreductase [Chloroflexi bacterium]|nr:SDR family NAD(P)-dependent oxidoreductase [Chloroflexota bacterium]